MKLLRDVYQQGRVDAFVRYKLAAPDPAPTNPTVQKSTLLTNERAPSGLSSTALSRMQPATTPDTVKQLFSAQEQSQVKTNPARKIAAENLCTTCRKDKHYGPCLKPMRTRPDGESLKQADFNMGMRGDDPVTGGDGSEGPSTSPGYNSATVADSALARAREGRPADEQAATAFADLFRHLGVSSAPDQSLQSSGGLANKSADFNWGTGSNSATENRGPTVNPYEQRRTTMSTPIGWGDEGMQRITRAFDQIDNFADSTCVDGHNALPDGPDVLG